MAWRPRLHPGHVRVKGGETVGVGECRRGFLYLCLLLEETLVSAFRLTAALPHLTHLPPPFPLQPLHAEPVRGGALLLHHLHHAQHRGRGL